MEREERGGEVGRERGGERKEERGTEGEGGGGAGK